MADRRIEVVNRRTIVTASGAALIAPLIASQVEAKTAPDRAAVEAALLEIQEIASGAPDAPSILNKLDKDAFTAAGLGASQRLVIEKLRETVSILDFIPANLHAAIAAGLHTGDLTPYWALAQAATNGAPILFPSPGVYFGNFVIDRSGAGMIGGVAANYDGAFSWISGTLLRPYDVEKPVVTLDGDASGGFLANNRIENLSITATANSGVTKQAPCIYITNTMDSRTVNEMVLRNLDLRGGSAGIYCDGGCLTATLENIFTRFNVDGIVLKSADAALYINGWVSTNVHTGYNDRHGLVADSVSVSTEMIWKGFKSEFNGIDPTVPECYGVYMRNTEGWSFPSLYMEGNGDALNAKPQITSKKSYGLRMEGLNRGFGLGMGAIILKSTFPVRISGTNPSGDYNNLYNVVPLTLASVTGATWSSAGGGQATLTVNVDLTTLFGVGDGLIVRAVGSTGGTGRGYNGMFPIVSITSTTIVVSHPLTSSPGTFSSNGLVNAPEHIIEGTWSGDLPKIQLGSAISGNVYSTFDGNGAYLTTPGVDYVGAPTATLSLRHRKAVMINTASGDVRLTAITGLRPGETFQIVSGPFVTTYDVILDASMMLGGADSVIDAKTAKTYMVLGAGIGAAAFVEV